MRRLVAEARRCASLRASVLLQGESGSGKDVVARALHLLSRRPGQYVPLNVGAIPESLADAELFGHKRGAFTGAVIARAGAFEQAHRGTLFLDEIADLPPSVQVKLLRVVEDRQVRPIGSPHSVDVDVRVVSASWAILEDRVAEEKFREDLFHRISTFVIRVPPLRARKSDIPALAHALLARIRDETGPRSLGSAALARLVAHSWPGNVRELASVLYRAAVTADGEHIESSHVEAALAGPSKARPRALSESEAVLLLREHGGNVSAAARTAGVPRSTFRSWLDKG
jgi:two-component system response regulator GlrR